jgi:tetratricopeptide (TPR) repeat protein
MADKNKMILPVLIVIIIIMGFAIGLLSRDKARPDAGEGIQQQSSGSSDTGIAQTKEAKDIKSLARSSEIENLKKLTLEERAQVNAALNYRKLKEKYRKRSEKKRKVKQAFYEQGGSEIALARKAMRENRPEIAINHLQEALKKAGNNDIVKQSAYRYLAQNYEKTQEIPKYCVNMYKYLDLFEKTIKDDEEAKEQVKLFKIKLKESIDKFQNLN